MLKKLLKYDFKSVFKYWWIAAVTSVAISVMGGFCIAILDSDKTIPAALSAFSGIGIFVAIMGIVAFLITSTILIYIRFYKNFFTDEGYLTFTLPVKRSQLLNSKLIMDIVTNAVTFMVFIADIIIILSIGFGKHIFSEEVWEEITLALNQLISTITADNVFYLILFIIEFLILVFLSLAFSSLFLFGCITFASIVVKKAKVVAAIGIYYVANSVFSGLFQTLFLFGASPLEGWFTDLTQNLYQPIFAATLLVIILLFALVCALLYLLVYWLLDRKLNLA